MREKVVVVILASLATIAIGTVVDRVFAGGEPQRPSPVSAIGP